MTSAALIFFSPAWPRSLLARFGRDMGPAPLDDKPTSLPSPPAFAAIALYVVVQVALPPSHFVYPGAVLWNEDGMRFAWHVMIREKHGAVTFIAEIDGNKRVEVPPSTYLTWRQEREMGGQPDLILQLARHVGDDLHRRGYHRVRVFAETSVSLNGRPPKPMIDPMVDLLRVHDVGPREWVLSEPREAPPIIQPLR